jgi:guanylate kinase
VNEPHPLLVVISGPSGAGKDAVLRSMKEEGYPFHFVVTVTDRDPRPGEVDGKDYYFISTAQFRAKIEAGEFLEHANVYGDRKGVLKSEVRQALASGLDVVLRVDVQGAATIRQLVPEAVAIFLTAPSEEELIGRLKERRTESAAKLRRRIATARAEMCRIPEFAYVVVNRQGQLHDAVRRIVAIMEAEKRRVDWKAVAL